MSSDCHLLWGTGRQRQGPGNPFLQPQANTQTQQGLGPGAGFPPSFLPLRQSLYRGKSSLASTCLWLNSQFLSKLKESEVAQSCLTLCNPMDCSPQGSSIRGIFQARVLEWVAIGIKKQLPSLKNKGRRTKSTKLEMKMERSQQTTLKYKGS